MSSPAETFRSKDKEQRIPILDSLRGIAILGILLMNIPYFGMGEPSANDPSVLNEFGSLNYNTWWFIQFIPEGTQRAIFSMLFGAGILLLIDYRGIKATESRKINYFFRRQLWLIAFSIIDVFVLLWNGDILFDYAIFGMIMLAFRKMSTRRLIFGAVACLLFMLLRENRELYLKKERIFKGEQATLIRTLNQALTIEQERSIVEAEEFKKLSNPEYKELRNDSSMAKVKAGYFSLFQYRAGSYFNKMFDYIFFAPWDILLFMFLGMAFLKMGLLTGRAPTKTYGLLFIIGTICGLLCSYFRLRQQAMQQFDAYEISKHSSFAYYELSRTLRTLGIFGLFMLLFKSNRFNFFFRFMQPVGRMAFTNYLTQSLLCGIYFYGFGMFGKLERFELYYVVGIIWVIQISWSHLWLRHFKLGPLEGIWRKLASK